MSFIISGKSNDVQRYFIPTSEVFKAMPNAVSPGIIQLQKPRLKVGLFLFPQSRIHWHTIVTFKRRNGPKLL